MSTTAALWPAGVAYVAAGGCPARPLRVLRCSPRKSFGIDRHHQAVPELGAADGAGQSAIIERGGQRRAAESRGDRIQTGIRARMHSVGFLRLDGIPAFAGMTLPAHSIARCGLQ